MIYYSTSFYGQELSILYFNDAHEIAPVPYEGKTKGGVARLKTLVDKISINNKVITVFGGDLAGGTLFGKVYRGFPMIEAFNQIPIDIANFGQHEFDFGIDNAQSLVEKSYFLWVTTNLTHKNGTPLFNLPNYRIINSNGFKIAFIGITDKVNTSSPGEDIYQQNIIESARKALDSLKKEKPDYIIAITQMSIEQNQKVLEALPEISLALTEENSEKISRVESIKNQYIIAPIGNMGSLAEIKLKKNEDNIQSAITFHYLGDDVVSDSKLRDLEVYYQSEMKKSLSQRIGRIQQTILRGKHRQEESALGNFISDAFRHYYKTSIGMINAGGIRFHELPSEVLRKDIYAILPFDNKVSVVELTGKEIIDLIKTGLINYNKLGGEFLQVSGIQYEFTKSAESNIPQLKNVIVDDKPINESKVYQVAMTDYIIKGGGEFSEIGMQKIKTPKEQIVTDTDAVIWYLKNFENINPKIEERILIK